MSDCRIELITPAQRSAINIAVQRLREAAEQLDFAVRQSLEPEARSSIIGSATRRSIEKLNDLRDAWGFETIEREDDRAT